MKNHYIPKLLLRQFSDNNKRINLYDYEKRQFETRKIKNTFSSDNIFTKEIEDELSKKIESKFGDLLNNRLIKNDIIYLTREENFTLRKFFLINNLRSPLTRCKWDEMLKITKSENHPSALRMNFIKKNSLFLYENFEDIYNESDENYYKHIEQVLDMNSFEDFKAKAKPASFLDINCTIATVSTLAIWDCEDSGAEFILPRLQGISEMDNESIQYKAEVINKYLEYHREHNLDKDEEAIMIQLLYASMFFSENYSMYPISPTRVIVFFSPYFKAFFPAYIDFSNKIFIPSLLKKKQYDKHFYYKKRMELFQPCKTKLNKEYEYTVKKLKKEEVLQMNLYISDLHFGPKNVIRFDQRPFMDVEEMDAKIIALWNEKVSKGDNVYVLGDFCYRNEQPEQWYLEQLKGHKHLIIGNHDTKLLKNEIAMAHFESVDKIMNIKYDHENIILCHYPLATWDKAHYGSWHIYGHVHGNNSDEESMEFINFMVKKEKALNAGCMINNYMPATLEELVVNNEVYWKG